MGTKNAGSRSFVYGPESLKRSALCSQLETAFSIPSLFYTIMVGSGEPRFQVHITPKRLGKMFPDVTKSEEQSYTEAYGEAMQVYCSEQFPGSLPLEKVRDDKQAAYGGLVFQVVWPAPVAVSSPTDAGADAGAIAEGAAEEAAPSKPKRKSKEERDAEKAEQIQRELAGLAA